MRLDHLLSKEHLASGRPVMGWLEVSRPVVPAERVGDGARGWNIDCGRLTSWWRPSTPGPSGFWVGTVGCWGGVGWARCWVLREQPEGCFIRVATSLVPACGWGWGSGGCGLVPLRRTTHALVRKRWGVGRRWGEGACSGRSLRTAQWTRASFLNDFCGQVYKGTGWMPWH